MCGLPTRLNSPAISVSAGATCHLHGVWIRTRTEHSGLLTPHHSSLVPPSLATHPPVVAADGQPDLWSASYLHPVAQYCFKPGTGSVWSRDLNRLYAVLKV